MFLTKKIARTMLIVVLAVFLLTGFTGCAHTAANSNKPIVFDPKEVANYNCEAVIAGIQKVSARATDICKLMEAKAGANSPMAFLWIKEQGKEQQEFADLQWQYMMLQQRSQQISCSEELPPSPAQVMQLRLLEFAQPQEPTRILPGDVHGYE
jgi:hypothetical protein